MNEVRVSRRRWAMMLAGTALLAAGMAMGRLLEPGPAEAQPAPSTRVGHYQISISENRLYFIDTATGRVWVSAHPDGSPPRARWAEVNSPAPASRFRN